MSENTTLPDLDGLVDGDSCVDVTTGNVYVVAGDEWVLADDVTRDAGRATLVRLDPVIADAFIQAGVWS